MRRLINCLFYTNTSFPKEILHSVPIFLTPRIIISFAFEGSKTLIGVAHGITFNWHPSFTCHFRGFCFVRSSHRFCELCRYGYVHWNPFPEYRSRASAATFLWVPRRQCVVKGKVYIQQMAERTGPKTLPNKIGQFEWGKWPSGRRVGVYISWPLLGKLLFPSPAVVIWCVNSSCRSSFLVWAGFGKFRAFEYGQIISLLLLVVFFCLRRYDRKA